MDELYILGCLFLVFALVVAPVLAVIGFNRSTAARQEIARLRQRIEALEQRSVAEKAPEQVHTAAPVKTPAPVSEAVNAPVDPGVPNRPSLKQSLCLYRRQNVLPPLAASCPR